MRRRLDPRRWALAGVGLGFVAMGAVGVMLPGVPTTIFLILASWCFAKSCPALERWITEQPIFRPYARYLDPSTPMPRRARVVSGVLMWSAILASAALFYARDALVYAGIPLALAGILGTVAISRYRRAAPNAHSEEACSSGGDAAPPMTEANRDSSSSSRLIGTR